MMSRRWEKTGTGERRMKDGNRMDSFQMEELKMQKEHQKERVDKTTRYILNEPVRTFRSSWVQGMQLELQRAAKAADKNVNGNRKEMEDVFVDARDVLEDEVDKEWNAGQERTPDSWEERVEWEDKPLDWRKRLGRKPIERIQPTGSKVRKPPLKITKWFGVDSMTEDSSDEDMGVWNNV